MVQLTGLLGLLLGAFSQPIRAAGSLTLTWGPQSDPGVAGYAVYYGTARGVYSHRLEIGNWRKATIHGLIEGVTYFFIVKSRDASGQESLPSKELSYTVPGVCLTTVNLRSSPAGANVLQVASAGVVPFAWVLEASPDLKTWKPVMTGANSLVNFSFPISNAPRMFFRLRQGITKTRSPQVTLTVRSNPSNLGSLRISTIDVVPFAWALEVTRDFQSWQTCATGSNSVVDVTVVTAKSTAGFFRVRSQ